MFAQTPAKCHCAVPKVAANAGNAEDALRLTKYE